MRNLEIVSAILLLVGGLNWGLVGVLQVDIVAALFGGSATFVSRVIYTLVGLAALWEIYALSTARTKWLSSEGTKQPSP